MDAEAMRRHGETVRQWEAMGHRQAPCTGHGHPLPDCPAPGVHARIFPPERLDHVAVPKVSAFTETAVLDYVLQGDLARAHALVRSMLPHERGEYEQQLNTITEWLREGKR